MWYQIQRKFLWKAMMTRGRWWYCLRLWGTDISCHHNCCARGKQRSDIPNLVFQNTTAFFTLKKKPTDLSLWQKGLCILDVFAAHRSNEFLNVMAIKNTSCVRQHKLQPFKIILKNIWKEHKERISAVLCTLNWKITWWHRTGKHKNKFKTSCYQRKACTVAYKCYTKNVQHKKKWFNDLWSL